MYCSCNAPPSLRLWSAAKDECASPRMLTRRSRVSHANDARLRSSTLSLRREDAIANGGGVRMQNGSSEPLAYRQLTATGAEAAAASAAGASAESCTRIGCPVSACSLCARWSALFCASRSQAALTGRGTDARASGNCVRTPRALGGVCPLLQTVTLPHDGRVDAALKKSAKTTTRCLCGC